MIVHSDDDDDEDFDQEDNLPSGRRRELIVPTRVAPTPTIQQAQPVVTLAQPAVTLAQPAVPQAQPAVPQAQPARVAPSATGPTTRTIPTAARTRAVRTAAVIAAAAAAATTTASGGSAGAPAAPSTPTRPAQPAQPAVVQTTPAARPAASSLQANGDFTPAIQLLKNAIGGHPNKQCMESSAFGVFGLKPQLATLVKAKYGTIRAFVEAHPGDFRLFADASNKRWIGLASDHQASQSAPVNNVVGTSFAPPQHPLNQEAQHSGPTDEAGTSVAQQRPLVDVTEAERRLLDAAAQRLRSWLKDRPSQSSTLDGAAGTCSSNPELSTLMRRISFVAFVSAYSDLFRVFTNSACMLCVTLAGSPNSSSSTLPPSAASRPAEIKQRQSLPVSTTRPATIMTAASQLGSASSLRANEDFAPAIQLLKNAISGHPNKQCMESSAFGVFGLKPQLATRVKAKYGTIRAFAAAHPGEFRLFTSATNKRWIGLASNGVVSSTALASVEISAMTTHRGPSASAPASDYRPSLAQGLTTLNLDAGHLAPADPVVQQLSSGPLPDIFPSFCELPRDGSFQSSSALLESVEFYGQSVLSDLDDDGSAPLDDGSAPLDDGSAPLVGPIGFATLGGLKYNFGSEYNGYAAGGSDYDVAAAYDGSAPLDGLMLTAEDDAIPTALAMVILRVPLPPGECGRFIGLRSQNLISIRARTGAIVWFEAASSCLVLEGSSEQVASAKEMIDGQIAAFEQGGQSVYLHPNRALVLLSSRLSTASSLFFVRDQRPSSSQHSYQKETYRLSATAEQSPSRSKPSSPVRRYQTQRQARSFYCSDEKHHALDEVRAAISKIVEQTKEQEVYQTLPVSFLHDQHGSQVVQPDGSTPQVEEAELVIFFKFGRQFFYPTSKLRQLPSTVTPSQLRRMVIGHDADLKAVFVNDVPRELSSSVFDRLQIAGFREAKTTELVFIKLTNRINQTGESREFILNDGGQLLQDPANDPYAVGEGFVYLSAILGHPIYDFRVAVHALTIPLTASDWEASEFHEQFLGAQWADGRVLLPSLQQEYFEVDWWRRKSVRVLLGAIQGISVEFTFTDVIDPDGPRQEVFCKVLAKDVKVIEILAPFVDSLIPREHI
ncbi:hypothetical protein CAOG_06553 [Capsaspora owczarzaki ATCC 30864]|uniref:K Homology domain-containing protein n=1 Tax=Capsaspora owczarzaki (strain ATCC 30864) TaxID=595528 RepID=A0A0D2X4K0_CAPO3|nr:hypothetical protein CAOG_06553 [Capsaspora owczarzaki ATCC 30864]KJE96194.1 hypothetical protein CAOG_006553 [Capsaspora owczarzaki ATCC 30864]|eukprot:XP_004345302.1 hypothetical protein CAOG_06553 [Capsaspora owczarzaki ATCC 30864]